MEIKLPERQDEILSIIIEIGPSTGVRIAQELEQRSGKRVLIGSFYRDLHGLVKKKLVWSFRAQHRWSHNGQTTDTFFYAATDLGKRVTRREKKERRVPNQAFKPRLA